MMIDWPWWIMFAAAMVSSYFREMRLRAERNDPRCTLFYTYQQPAALKNGSPLAPSGPKAPASVYMISYVDTMIS